MAKYYSVTMKISDGYVLTYPSGEVESDEKPDDTVLELRRRTIYIDWFNSIEEARAFIAEQKTEEL